MKSGSLMPSPPMSGTVTPASVAAGAQGRPDLVLTAEEEETGRCRGGGGEEVGEGGRAVGHGLLHAHRSAPLVNAVRELVGEALRHRLGLAHDGHVREAECAGLLGEELGLRRVGSDEAEVVRERAPRLRGDFRRA